MVGGLQSRADFWLTAETEKGEAFGDESVMGLDISSHDKITWWGPTCHARRLQRMTVIEHMPFSMKENDSLNDYYSITTSGRCHTGSVMTSPPYSGARLDRDSAVSGE